ncbi:pilus assembly protein CpaF [Dongia deserti]|uniref:pilus assembly protein CpaF n=1 Tax=Dongia deserti TaxID=2268030 RepID=UPI000E651A77|nr:pilus assembly protein CpaF [Dongia deserti]
MQHRLTIDVFCHAEQTSASAKALAEQRAFARCKIAVRDGGLARAVTHYADHPSPHLIIVEDDGDTATLQSRLDALAQVVEPGRKLIVVGAVNDISVYRRIVSLGVTDYLVSPLSLEGMMDAIERAAHDPKGPERCRLVAVTGARGGVGASTIAHNMAWASARRLNLKTILADMDLTFGTAGLAFNQDPRTAFGEAFNDPERIDITLLERYMTGEDDNLQILSTPGILRHYEGIDEEAVEKTIDLCRQMAKLVIVDVPHVWTDWSEALLMSADETVLVLAPDIANIRDSRNLLDFLNGKRGDSKQVKVVINKSDVAKRTRLLPKDISNTLGIQPVAAIPFDPTTFIEAANDGKMIGDRFKSHKLIGVFTDLVMRTGVRGSVKGAAKPAKKLAFPSLFRKPQPKVA